LFDPPSRKSAKKMSHSLAIARFEIGTVQFYRIQNCFARPRVLRMCQPPSSFLSFMLPRGVLNFAFAMSSKAKQREAELNFESAMDRLEKIVEQMESGKLPLEDLIVRYEEGTNLVKICQERLAKAEQKIEIIARNSAGKAVVKDFEATPEPAVAAEAVAGDENTNDEIKLF
jgi:exodeoxyribonuclease VII small subunit